ncbi:SGNH/GDSL hydrolase family protein [Vagococcus fluvialis]|uniref:SGNH/GDSL hydrolase family protein n=1 Tax=Vagococcus fluvialis TaxID=2738 RepID=UPI003D0A43BF
MNTKKKIIILIGIYLCVFIPWLYFGQTKNDYSTSDIDMMVSLKKEKDLEGKSIVTIGDSITWLDGKSITNVGEINGYQKVLKDKGATIFSYGNSGGTYRLYNEKSDYKHRSIYQEIVVKRMFDFSNIDIITLFGGTNDIGAGMNLGLVDSLDPNTTFGALNLLIDFLIQNNPQTEIILFSPIYSTEETRTPEKMQELVSGLEEIAKIKEIKFVDIYNNFPINPLSAPTLLYDGLHPNSLGMEIIGECFYKSILEIESAEELMINAY